MNNNLRKHLEISQGFEEQAKSNSRMKDYKIFLVKKLSYIRHHFIFQKIRKMFSVSFTVSPYTIIKI